eukprot:jgi/Picre1/34710/NNA_002178.t1
MGALYGYGYDLATMPQGEYAVQQPLTAETRQEMKRLNQCGQGPECDAKKFEFLLRMAGLKIVKNKIDDRIPPLSPPPVGPPPPVGLLPRCNSSPCGAIVDGAIRFGRCATGVGGPTVVCNRNGFKPFPENFCPNWLWRALCRVLSLL